MNKRLWIETIGCSLLCIGLMHAIPSSYIVRQTYGLFGNIANESDLAQDLAESIRTQLQEITLKKLKCTPTATALQLDCSFVAKHRSEAASVATALRDTAPTKVGWIRKDSLQAKLKDTQTQMELWSNELGALEGELRNIEPKILETQKLLSKEQTLKANIENDLSNRKRQLEILEEGIATKPKSERAPFEVKRGEVGKIITDLQTQLDASNQNLFSIGQPIERQKTILETLPKLRAQMDLAQAQIASWSALLQSAAEATTVADPNHFQLAAIPAEKNVTPVRSWAHLPWSSLLGLLVIGFVRRKELSDWKERYYTTPDEVTEDTGLPHLGTL